MGLNNNVWGEIGIIGSFLKTKLSGATFYVLHIVSLG